METCCIKETFTFGTTEPNTPYEPLLQLGGFPRALDIADNFQEYRIVKAEYSYTPYYDTFSSAYQAGSSNVNMSVPSLYTRSQVVESPSSYNLAYLTAQGAKPIRLDDKIIRHTYRPHVLQTTSQAGSSGQYVKPLKSPWISTHTPTLSGTPTMDDTLHYTHNFWIQQDIPNPDPAQSQVCSTEVNVYFEFRKPWDLSLSNPSGAPAKRQLKVVQGSV